MVFKTITNFSRYSSTKANASHSFFDPSYIKHQKVSLVDGILGTGTRNHSTSNSQTALATSSNLVIFDPNVLNRNGSGANAGNTSSKDQRILLKKATHKVNKNGHVNVSIDNITDQFTTLTLRKSNATHSKTIKVNKNDFIRANFKPIVPAQAQVSSPAPAKLSQEEASETVHIDVPMDASDFLKFQEGLIANYTEQGKFNEIYALYTLFKQRSVVPSLHVYNMVLKSIPLRQNVKETIEENMTLLLSVYSDMLSNGVKPNHNIYNNVITPLLSASIKCYTIRDTQQALQYFKVANDLFQVCSSAKSTDFAPELYEKLLVCYNVMKFSNVDVREFAKLMSSKLGYHNILYYLGLINLCKNAKDPQLALELYSQFKSLAYQYPSLLEHQLQVYSALIRCLISCNQMETAASILDTLINNIRSESGLQKDILPLLSSFIVSLTEIGLVADAYKTLEKFDAISWLPKLGVNSLLILVDNACNCKEIGYATKFWEFAVVRKDFDSSIIHSDNNLVNLMGNMSSVETKATFTKLVQLGFVYGDKQTIIRLAKEILLKDSVKLDIPTELNLVSFLFANGLPKLAIKIISNLGFKLDHDIKLNQYLSSVIDAIPLDYIPELIKSPVFSQAVKSYSLIEDNIYGIYKAIQSVWNYQMQGDKEFQKYLHNHYTLLFEEFNDLDNFYVELPQEIVDFKSNLKLHL